jgi:hypothetical protein
MLVGLYAPELAPKFDRMRERFTKMLACLLETSMDVAHRRPAQDGIKRMLADLTAGAGEIIELKKELAGLARNHDL